MAQNAFSKALSRSLCEIEAVVDDQTNAATNLETCDDIFKAVARLSDDQITTLARLLHVGPHLILDDPLDVLHRLISFFPSLGLHTTYKVCSSLTLFPSPADPGQNPSPLSANPNPPPSPSPSNSPPSATLTPLSTLTLTIPWTSVSSPHPGASRSCTCRDGIDPHSAL